MKLWPHQQLALPRLEEGNYMLAWEPGVGKTMPALVASSTYQKPSLYLCPAPLRNQIGQVASTTHGHGNVQVIQSGRDALDPNAHLVVCSYEQASDVQRWKEFMGRKWACLILDEAHYVKNTQAKRTKAVYGARIASPGALWRAAERVWPMTGTPILNDPTELWPHVSRLWPEVLLELEITTADQWMREFCVVRDTPYGPKIVGGRNLSRLNQILRPRMSRLTLAETQPDMPPVLIDRINLPPEEIDTTGLDPEALALLQTLLNVADEDEEPDFGALELHLAALRRQWGLTKVPGIVDLVKTELYGGQEKVVVFFQHTDVGRRLAEELDRFGPLLLDGSTKDKSAVVNTFRANPLRRVLLAQIVAGGTGLDGMQHATNRVLLAEYAWTPAVNQQAIARVARAGQKLPVRASYVALSGSMDDDIARALVRKQKIVKEVLDGK